MDTIPYHTIEKITEIKHRCVSLGSIDYGENFNILVFHIQNYVYKL